MDLRGMGGCYPTLNLGKTPPSLKIRLKTGFSHIVSSKSVLLRKMTVKEALWSILGLQGL
jgi:hypothetical protein